MDKDIRNLLIMLGTATVVLYLFRPKKYGYFKVERYPKPAVAAQTDSEYQNAVDSIKALRLALKANEPQSVISGMQDELKNSLKIDTRISNGRIMAMDLSGKLIAKEK